MATKDRGKQASMALQVQHSESEFLSHRFLHCIFTLSGLQALILVAAGTSIGRLSSTPAEG